jgi:hypothetical protein
LAPDNTTEEMLELTSAPEALNALTRETDVGDGDTPTVA